MAYADPADMKKRYDHRRLGQLVKDDGTQATEAALDADDNLLECIDDACGMVNSYALRGGRYTVEDLEALTGVDLKFLKRLVCDLTYGLLVQRRGYTGSELDSLAPGYKTALAWLDKLAEGSLIFNDADAILAGKPHRVVLSYDRTLVSSTRRLYGDLQLRPGNPGDPVEYD
jgi:phage gp36-like protein